MKTTFLSGKIYEEISIILSLGLDEENIKTKCANYNLLSTARGKPHKHGTTRLTSICNNKFSKKAKRTLTCISPSKIENTHLVLLYVDGIIITGDDHPNMQGLIKEDTTQTLEIENE